METGFKAWLGAVALGVMALSGCKTDNAVQKNAPEFRGTRGESCLVTNDCKKGLLCVAQTCVAEDVPLAATSKTCISAQCIDDKDCCPPQTKSEAAACTQLKDNCSQGSTFACDQFDATCGACTAKCTDHECVTTATPGTECQANADCFSEVDICVSGRCVECAKDTDCPTGNVCELSRCVAGCTRNEQCGAMSNCTKGRCEKRGCVSDYECAAFLGVGDAVCKDEKCTVSCSTDGQCAALGAGGLSVCEKQHCVYVGCKENADCAALLAGDNPGNIGNGNLALCVDAK
jgi:hypothetical protein